MGRREKKTIAVYPPDGLLATTMAPASPEQRAADAEEERSIKASGVSQSRLRALEGSTLNGATLVAALDAVAVSLGISVLAYYVQSLGGTVTDVGGMMAVFGACNIAASAWMGVASDFTGRKPILFLSIVCVGIGFLATGAAQSITWLYAARAWLGFFSGVGSISRAFIADVTPPGEERTAAMGRVGSLTLIGYSIGAPSGSLLALLPGGYRTPFFVGAGFSALLALFIAVRMPSEGAVRRERELTKWATADDTMAPAAIAAPSTPAGEPGIAPTAAHTLSISRESSHVEKPPTAAIIDGAAIADSMLSELRVAVSSMPSSPMLVVVLVGSDAASLSYIKRKEAAAAQCGVRSRLVQLDEATSQSELLATVDALNSDEDVDGIIVQLPLPAHLDARAAMGGVSAMKDVDGFLPSNVGATALHGHEPLCCPCTPKGCLQLIRSVGVPLRGKEACVIGASNIVGLPMGMLLLKEGMTVTTCHIDTPDVPSHSRRADVLVVAVGKAGLVQAGWVKPGAIVIDVGINFVEDATKKSGRRIAGDVDFEAVRTIAGHITPVPGGVGPMTVAMLMSNTVDACRRRSGRGVTNATTVSEGLHPGALPTLVMISLYTLTMTMGQGFMMVVLPLFIEDKFGWGAVGYSFIITSYTLGGAVEQFFFVARVVRQCGARNVSVSRRTSTCSCSRSNGVTYATPLESRCCTGFHRGRAYSTCCPRFACLVRLLLNLRPRRHRRGRSKDRILSRNGGRRIRCWLRHGRRRPRHVGTRRFGGSGAADGVALGPRGGRTYGGADCCCAPI